MSIIPDPYEAQELRVLFAGNLIIDVAENALRAFGQDIDVHTAVKLLPLWRYARELSVREVEAVLARFVPPPLEDDREDPVTGEALPSGVDGYQVGGLIRVPLGEGNSGPGGAFVSPSGHVQNLTTGQWEPVSIDGDASRGGER